MRKHKKNTGKKANSLGISYTNQMHIIDPQKTTHISPKPVQQQTYTNTGQDQPPNENFPCFFLKNPGDQWDRLLDWSWQYDWMWEINWLPSLKCKSRIETYLQNGNTCIFGICRSRTIGISPRPRKKWKFEENTGAPVTTYRFASISNNHSAPDFPQTSRPRFLTPMGWAVT